jgi:hypothetical protein
MGSTEYVPDRSLSNPDLVEKLKASIKDSKVLTPTSDGYKESIKRWSDSSEKQAVSPHDLTVPTALI